MTRNNRETKTMSALKRASLLVWSLAAGCCSLAAASDTARNLTYAFTKEEAAKDFSQRTGQDSNRIQLSAVSGQEIDRARLRELREKARNRQLSPAEQMELDEAIKALRAGRPATLSATSGAPRRESGKQPSGDVELE